MDRYLYNLGKADAEKDVQEPRSDDASYLKGYNETKIQLQKQKERFRYE